MATKLFLAIACLLLVLCVQQSYGIKCYDCTTCNDPFDKAANEKKVKDCPNTCQKIKGNGDITSKWKKGYPDPDIIPSTFACNERGQYGDFCPTTFVSRSCAPQGLANKCADAAGGSVCGCNSDLCNTATTSYVSMPSIMVVASGVLMFKTLY